MVGNKSTSIAAWVTILVSLVLIFNMRPITSTSLQACLPVIAPLAPCLPSFFGQPPSEICCQSMAIVSNSSMKPVIKQTICLCLQNVLMTLPFDSQGLQNVANQCNATLNVPMSLLRRRLTASILLFR